MKFEKEVLFLGMTANTLRDGRIYYSVQFFEQNGVPCSVNVMDDRLELVQVLKTLCFADKVLATFFLRPQDKFYKLCLADAVPA